MLLTAAQRRKAEARDELAEWRQAPYAEAVAAAPRSAFACQAAAALLTARREAERPRVRERALVAYQALRDSLQVRWRRPAASRSVCVRVCVCVRARPCACSRMSLLCCSAYRPLCAAAMSGLSRLGWSASPRRYAHAPQRTQPLCLPRGCTHGHALLLKHRL